MTRDPRPATRLTDAAPDPGDSREWRLPLLEKPPTRARSRKNDTDTRGPCSEGRVERPTGGTRESRHDSDASHGMTRTRVTA